MYLKDKTVLAYTHDSQMSYWRSPIWQVQTKFDKQFNDQLIEEIYDVSKDIVGGKTGIGSIWDHSRPNLDILKKEITDIVEKTIVKDIPEIAALNIKGCKHYMGWVNIREPGDIIEIHGHSECDIAVTYYIKAKENSGDLVLYDASSAIDWNNNSLSNSPYIRTKRFKPIEGSLIFFPSYVLHSVDENKSDDIRISLSTDLHKIVDENAYCVERTKTWAKRIINIKD
jgi:uncharacterized protein (TIGR02466 family)